jgi:hypothetical protein
MALRPPIRLPSWMISITGEVITTETQATVVSVQTITEVCNSQTAIEPQYARRPRTLFDVYSLF